MKVVISDRAEKELRKLSKINQIAVAKKIRDIAAQKSHLHGKLQGYKDVYRVRIGNHRIVYRVFPNKLYIILIGHRREIYRLLKQFFN